VGAGPAAAPISHSLPATAALKQPRSRWLFGSAGHADLVLPEGRRPDERPVEAGRRECVGMTAGANDGRKTPGEPLEVMVC